MKVLWQLGPEVGSTDAAALVVRLVDDLARAVDPSRPPLTAAVRGESESVEESQGETVTTRTYSYGGVELHETETDYFDGTTATSYGCLVEAVGLPAGARIALWLDHNVPALVQPTRCGGELAAGSPGAEQRLAAAVAAVALPSPAG